MHQTITVYIGWHKQPCRWPSWIKKVPPYTALFCSFRQRSSLLWTHVLRPFVSRPSVLAQEGRSLDNAVCECMRDWRVRKGRVAVSSFVRYLQRAPSRRGLLSGLGPTDWCLLFNVSHWFQPHLSASADVSTAGTLTLLIKMPAMVTFYRGHHRTLCCLPRIISLIIMCIRLVFFR